MDRKSINTQRIRRRSRTRHKIGKGTAKRPRLSVFRSGRHIYAQLIDDEGSRTIAFSSSLEAGVKGNKVEQAQVVGQLIAEEAHKVGVKRVIFDKGAYRYHGRVQALAEAAREKGLKL